MSKKIPFLQQLVSARHLMQKIATKSQVAEVINLTIWFLLRILKLVYRRDLGEFGDID